MDVRALKSVVPPGQGFIEELIVEPPMAPPALAAFQCSRNYQFGYLEHVERLDPLALYPTVLPGVARGK